jgi:type II secretion system protein H
MSPRPAIRPVQPCRRLPAGWIPARCTRLADAVRGRGRSGFTLLELILVLVVLGIGSLLAAARLGGLRGTIGVDQAARQVVDQARRCQHLAASTGQLVRLRLDLAQRTTTAALLDGVRTSEPTDGQPATVDLARSADRVVMSFARSDAVRGSGDDSTVDLLFSPDSRCDPAGTLSLVGEGRSASVRLHAGPRLPALVESGPSDPASVQR